jgi:predicted RNA-binding protein with PUA-like domain
MPITTAASCAPSAATPDFADTEGHAHEPARSAGDCAFGVHEPRSAISAMHKAAFMGGQCYQTGMPRYWLMKTEPDVYSIDDLARDERTAWEGVRNYQARNFMRVDMTVGDPVLFYHSSCEPAGVAGVARIASAAYPDPTQFDKKSEYYDPDSPKDEPRWSLVDVELVEKFAALVPLTALRAEPRLKGMPLLSARPTPERAAGHARAVRRGARARQARQAQAAQSRALTCPARVRGCRTAERARRSRCAGSRRVTDSRTTLAWA